MDTRNLQGRYIELTNEVLPKLAHEQHWPVRYNHCFQRIILDTIFKDCWYNHLDRSSGVPTCKQLTDSQLQQAIQVSKRMISSLETVEELNRSSLSYRNKLVNPSNF